MIVYITTNLINNKKYIGVDTKNNPNYLGSGIYLKKAIKKHGIENFKKEIIEECISEEEVFKKEIYWIEYYNAVLSLEFYNIAEGGHGGNTWKGKTEEEKLIHKNRTRNIHLGRKRSDITKQKMSESHKGKHSLDVLSKETLLKKSLSMMGKKTIT